MLYLKEMVEKVGILWKIMKTNINMSTYILLNLNINSLDNIKEGQEKI